MVHAKIVYIYGFPLNTIPDQAILFTADVNIHETV